MFMHTPAQKGAEDLHRRAPHMDAATHIARDDLGLLAAFCVLAQPDGVVLHTQRHSRMGSFLHTYSGAAGWGCSAHTEAQLDGVVLHTQRHSQMGSFCTHSGTSHTGCAACAPLATPCTCSHCSCARTSLGRAAFLWASRNPLSMRSHARGEQRLFGYAAVLWERSGC